jgi:hypothetical protein
MCPRRKRLEALNLGTIDVGQFGDLIEPDAGEPFLLFLIPQAKDRLVGEVFDAG